jgi:thiamine transport system permease protein
VPLVFVAVLFYWPILKICSLGFSGNWLTEFLEPRNVSVIWFTLWQAALSSLLTVVVAIPGAYLLYKKSFPG